MAGKPKGDGKKTPAQTTADVARAAYAAAKDANEKTDNTSTRAALEKADYARKAAVKAENRERFLNVGTKRTKKARAAIRQVAKVFNPKSYDFTAEEGKKILGGIDNALKEALASYNASQAGGTVTAGDDFSLG